MEWRADLPSAGTIDVGAVEPVSGTLRVAATANGAGRVESPLVDRTSSLVVRASDGSEARILRDVPWATAPVSTLTLESLVAVSVDANVLGTAVEGALVEVEPMGLLAPQTTLTRATTAATGSAALSVIRGGSFQLTVGHPTAGQHTQFLTDVQAGAIGQVTLPGTVLVDGQISIGSSSEAGAGAQVRLYCDDCTGADAERVHASAVADGTGRYMLRIADPGVDPT